MEDHRLLGRQLRQTKREIIKIADDWLRFLRTQLLLTRFVSRPMSPARMLQISVSLMSKLPEFYDVLSKL
ncbi:unnamed protein product [Dicrocoelium dendriticum]|nr:unnamed protein product [Dicrocoelium dendriticum]